MACLRLLCGSSVYDQKNALPSGGVAATSTFERVKFVAVAVTTVDVMSLSTLERLDASQLLNHTLEKPRATEKLALWLLVRSGRVCENMHLETSSSPYPIKASTRAALQ